MTTPFNFNFFPLSGDFVVLHKADFDQLKLICDTQAKELEEINERIKEMGERDED
jgi:hypothetical protein